MWLVLTAHHVRPSCQVLSSYAWYYTCQVTSPGILAKRYSYQTRVILPHTPLQVCMPGTFRSEQIRHYSTPYTPLQVCKLGGHHARYYTWPVFPSRYTCHVITVPDIRYHPLGYEWRELHYTYTPDQSQLLLTIKHMAPLFHTSLYQSRHYKSSSDQKL